MTFTAEQIRERTDLIRAELAKVLVGQKNVLENLLVTILAGGHAMLTGVPGLGKTMLVKSLAQLLSLSFKRIQFTPDLMPADIFGTEVLDVAQEDGKRTFRFIKGPIFTNLLLADEINRTPPKTQAALLEAMGEGHVTAAGRTYRLDAPFFVLATRNPIESEGTYPLPEAELDRFMLNITMDYLPMADEVNMVRRTTSPDIETLSPVLDAADLVKMQLLVREVPAPDNVIEYAVGLVNATRPQGATASEHVRKMVQWGAGSRASQALILAGKARALLQGRRNVAMEDIQALALPVLRHRIIMSFRAKADNVTPDDIINEVLKA